jgi:hypothetical protein
MLVLSTTNDKIQVVLGGAVTTNQLQCFASYRDRTSTTFSAGQNNLNTNNTTDVDLVAAPAASTQRLVDYLSIYNNDTVTQTVTVKLDVSGTERILHKASLATGAMLCFVEGEGFFTINSSGARIVANQPVTALYNNNYVPSGMLYENINRNLCPEVNTALLTSGRLSLEAIWLPAGVTINTISFCSATTVAGTPTNQIFGLYDNNRNLLMATANNTTTAWAANAIKTLSLTSSFTTTYAGLYYLGIMVTATTVPTIKGFTASTGGQLANFAPSLRGTSTTGLTTALPGTANAPAAVTTSAWCAVG